jgi:hypothetical protein
MSRPSKRIPHLIIEENVPIGRLRQLGDALILELTGTSNFANNKQYGGLSQNWAGTIQLPKGTVLSNEVRCRIESLATTYIRERAAEQATISYADAIKEAMALGSATSKLLKQLNQGSSLPQLLWHTIKTIEEPHTPSLRDDLYPLVSQLNRRCFLVIEKLKREEKAAAPQAIGTAWRRFVIGLADIYRDMTGKIPRAPEVNSANEDAVRHSAFTRFAHSIMMQIPFGLREHASEENGSINTFSGALGETLGRWKELRGIPKKEKFISRKT